MSRPLYSESLMLQTPVQYCRHRQSLPPPRPADLSLISTVLLVITLVICAAFFIGTLSYLLSNEYDVVIYPPTDGAHALIWAVKQSTRGCGGTC